MATPDQLRTLGREIEADLAAVDALMRDLSEARSHIPTEPTQENLSHIGYLLHGIYTGWESAFHRIAVTFENQLDPGQWHVQLLFRMTLDITGVRPAVIDPAMLEHLATLRSFRHFFRHSYAVPLRWRKMHLVLEAYDEVAQAVGERIGRFLGWVDQLGQAAPENRP